MVLEVDQSNLHRTRLIEEPARPLGDGEVRLRVERFGLSSNNVTYAVMGKALQYWQFFPAAADPDGTTWGRVPVWGFAEVTESRTLRVEEGRRVFGYLPASTELVIEAGRVDDHQFIDVVEHRRDLPSSYNGYRFCDTDRIWRHDREPHQMVFVPLFFTSFVIDDFLVDNEMFGAQTTVISSASSKTSIGVAHLLHSRGQGRVLGLTSSPHVAFVKGLGCYDDVLTYDQVSELAQTPAAYVDVAGNRDVLAAVHTHLGEQLRYSMLVGDTHWDHHAEAAAEIPGPKPQFLFAPTQLKKRAGEWGRNGLDERLSDAWEGFCSFLDGWVHYEYADTPEAVQATYLALTDGQIDPKVGHVCAMGPL